MNMSNTAGNQTFLSGINAEYIAHLYGQYLKNHMNVDQSWQAFFKGLNDTELSLLAELNGASWTPEENKKASRRFDHMGTGANVTERMSAPVNDALEGKDPEAVKRAAKDSIRALQLIRAYRARGHLLADLDPLGLKEVDKHPELDPAHYGFGSDDYNHPIFINGVLGMETATLREILDALRQTYCSTIGLEYLHMGDPDEKSWLQKRIETPRNKTDFTTEGKRAIYQRIVAAEVFEQFLHKKHPGTKRFGIDGGEALFRQWNKL